MTNLRKLSCLNGYRHSNQLAGWAESFRTEVGEATLCLTIQIPFSMSVI